MKKAVVTSKLKNIFPFLLSLVILFIIWAIASWKIDSVLILPGPALVLSEIFNLLFKSLFWNSFLFTFLRVFSAFLISVFLGTIIGFFCGESSFANIFFKIPLALIKVCPVISVILIAMFWFKSGTVPVFVSVLMTLPVMVSSVYSGFLKKNEKLYEMAQVYNFSKSKRFFYLDIPSVIPYFWNGSTSVFAMTWKVIIAGEALSIPKKGIGTLLHTNSVHLETAQVFAITILTVAISFIIEISFSQFIKKRYKNAIA